MNNQFRTSIIISTTAQKSRTKSLLKAIETVTTEQLHPAIPIIVVNGSIYDPNLLEALKSRPDIRFFYREEGNLPKARHFGRQMVETEFFGFLDDDDEYLPNTLHKTEAVLSDDANIDVLVSNGYRVTAENKELFIPNIEAVKADPTASLMQENWLSNCGGLYRSRTIGTEFFDPELKNLEWTYTALVLVTSRQLAFSNDPTFAYYETPGSLSRSPEYIENLPSTIEQLMALDLPRKLRHQLCVKLCAAYHHLSHTHRENRDLNASWKYHLRSISYPIGFFRYGLYTRYLLFDRLYS